MGNPKFLPYQRMKHTVLKVRTSVSFALHVGNSEGFLFSPSNNIVATECLFRNMDSSYKQKKNIHNDWLSLWMFFLFHISIQYIKPQSLVTSHFYALFLLCFIEAIVFPFLSHQRIMIARFNQAALVKYIDAVRISDRG